MANLLTMFSILLVVQKMVRVDDNDDDGEYDNVDNVCEDRLEAWHPGWEHGGRCFPAFTPFNNDNDNGDIDDNVDGCVKTD